MPGTELVEQALLPAEGTIEPSARMTDDLPVYFCHLELLSRPLTAVIALAVDTSPHGDCAKAWISATRHDALVLALPLVGPTAPVNRVQGRISFELAGGIEAGDLLGLFR